MSTNSILVTYATRYGSTQQAAEIIGDSLHHAGLAVDVQPMGEVMSIDQYGAVVLGAAIYNTKWHPDAHRFLAQYQPALSQRPVAIFSLGPTTRNPAAKRQSVSQLKQELAAYPWLRPVAFEMFVGRYDLKKMGFGSVARWIPLPDQSDPNAVRAWANKLCAQLTHAEEFQLA